MGQLLLLTIGALAVGAIGFGVAVLITGSDPGLVPAESQGQPVPLPADRPLAENDLGRIRFDTALRGYRMGQVDAALRRVAYDVGYKLELIGVLEAEVEALRDGRHDDADRLRAARAASQVNSGGSGTSTAAAEPVTAAGSTTDEPAGAETAAGTDSATGTDSAAETDGATETDRAGSDTSPHRPQEIRR